MTLNRIIQNRGYVFLGFFDKRQSNEPFSHITRYREYHALKLIAEQEEIATALFIDGNKALHGSGWELLKPKYFVYVLPHKQTEKPIANLACPRLIHQETAIMTDNIYAFTL